MITPHDPGNEWPEEIAKALLGSAHFLVFLTPNSIQSRNVRNEINYALNLSKPFVAVHLEDMELPPGLALRMGDIQAVMKWRVSAHHYLRALGRALPATLRRTKASEPASAATRRAGDTGAEEKLRQHYQAALTAAETAFIKQDYAAAARETKAALKLRPDGAEALDLAKRLQPKLEVRSEVDGLAFAAGACGRWDAPFPRGVRRRCRRAVSDRQHAQTNASCFATPPTDRLRLPLISGLYIAK